MPSLAIEQQKADLMARYQAAGERLVKERDEWKRRAEKAELMIEWMDNLDPELVGDAKEYVASLSRPERCEGSK